MTLTNTIVLSNAQKGFYSVELRPQVVDLTGSTPAQPKDQTLFCLLESFKGQTGYYPSELFNLKNKFSVKKIVYFFAFLCMQMAIAQTNAPGVCHCSATQSQYTKTEQKLLDLGLVDIAALDSTIAVYMVYATPYNFMGRKLYHDINHALMLPDAATRLIDAAKRLKKLRPDLSLIVYDAARPVSIQRMMWDMVKGTPMSNFVADPTKGRGLHNYGAAVDVTLMDCTGHPLPMGSEYDYFGDAARVNIEEQLLSTGEITQRELDNRLLLRKVMTEAGFRTITSEWWHFNLVSADHAIKTLQIIE